MQKAELTLEAANNIGDFFVLFIQSGTTSLMQDKFAAMSGDLHILISTILILSLVIYGVRFMAAEVASTGKQLLVTCIWVLLGLAIVEPGNYVNYIIEPIQSTSGNLASFFIGGMSGQTVFAAVNASFNIIFDYANKLISNAGITDLTPAFAGLAIYLLFGFYYAFMLIILLYAQICLSLFFIFGGVIIPLSGFQTMRGLFKSWITSIAKYALVSVVVSIIVALTCQLTDIVVVHLLNSNADAEMNTKYNAALLFCGFFGGFLMLKAMEITAEMTGGVVSDTKGVVMGSYGAARATMRGGNMALSKMKIPVK